ncbi:hypothetical protein UFOVP1369_12 [uncultured Caudovirales phage]|uniref:Uncharacterized protein n=1 Tax=uncultured Caudovirales phage TaxID=2100421 RepID=A0A6J5S4V3_9CAUD|nr:hypothetical protein UFOVP1369_12 [uncultured Caudovirales phage]
MQESIYISRNTPKTIRVFLVQDPSVQVFVKTNEAAVRAKLKGIRRDIYDQKFPRWAVFAEHKMQGNKTRGEPGWDWEFV